MSEGLFGYLFGLISGVVLIAALQSFNADSLSNIASKAKTECEKSLPRDENCVIIAIRKSKD